jgi:isopentenyl diphosphate isomerase/L-lactate dehydrogenase-like FMN-dependent dehydrogenase
VVGIFTHFHTTLHHSAVAMCGLGHDDGEVAWTKAAGRENVNFMIPSLASRSLEGAVECELNAEREEM